MFSNKYLIFVFNKNFIEKLNFINSLLRKFIAIKFTEQL